MTQEGDDRLLAEARAQALGQKAYPVLICASCHRLTGWVSADGACEPCVRRAVVDAAFADPRGGWVRIVWAAATGRSTRRPLEPGRIRLAAALGWPAAEHRLELDYWLVHVEPGVTGPIEPETGYELEVALRDEVELMDGSGILVRFQPVTHRFDSVSWRALAATRINHSAVPNPAEFPATLPIERLVEAWFDYQQAVVAFNRRRWAGIAAAREASWQIAEASNYDLRGQRGAAELLHEET